MDLYAYLGRYRETFLSLLYTQMIVTIPIFLNNSNLSGVKTSGDFQSISRKSDVVYEIMTLEEYRTAYPVFDILLEPAHCTPEETVVVVCVFETDWLELDDQKPRPHRYRDITVSDADGFRINTVSYGSWKDLLPSVELNGGELKVRNLPADTEVSHSTLDKVCREHVQQLNLEFTIGADFFCDPSSIVRIVLPNSIPSWQLAPVMARHHLTAHQGVVKELRNVVGVDVFHSLREIMGDYECIKFFLDTFEIKKVERIVETTVPDPGAPTVNRFTGEPLPPTHPSGLRLLDFGDVEIDELFCQVEYNVKAKRIGRCSLGMPSADVLAMDTIEIDNDIIAQTGNKRVHYPIDLTYLDIKDTIRVEMSTYDPDYTNVQGDDDSNDKMDLEREEIPLGLILNLNRRDRAKSATNIMEED